MGDRYSDDRRGGDDRRNGGGGGFRRPPRDTESMTSLRVGNLPFRFDKYWFFLVGLNILFVALIYSYQEKLYVNLPIRKIIIVFIF